METTDFRHDDDLSGGVWGKRPVIWRVLRKSEMRSGLMIVPDVGSEDAPKMGLVDDDHVVETLASDGSDQAFDVRIGVSRQLHRRRAVRHKLFELHIPSIRCAGASSN